MQAGSALAGFIDPPNRNGHSERGAVLLCSETVSSPLCSSAVTRPDFMDLVIETIGARPMNQ